MLLDCLKKEGTKYEESSANAAFGGFLQVLFGVTGAF